MESLRWILLAAGAIFVLVIYLLGRNRKRRNHSVIDELEDDLLDKAWGLEPDSRLSCQVEVGSEDLVIEIPKYTINQVSENH